MKDEFREKWPEMRMKHLEIVQGVIARMGTNNAGLKGYCMAMVAAIIGLAAAVSKEQILIYTLPIVFGFSILDASYLGMERGFRSHYDRIRQSALDCAPDFHVFADKVNWLRCYFSWSVFGFYGSVMIFMVLLSVFMPEKVSAN